MDRIRGYSGPQFEERRHLVLQPFDRGRNCFECGQLGHIARDCFQRVSRGFGGRVGAFLGRDFSHGWVNPVPPGIHLVPGHGREPGYFVRDNGYKVWQPQVAAYNNRGHSHPGFRGGREQESQPSAPSHMRVGERDRGRGSVWVDGVSRLSDQSSGGEAKKPRSSSGGCETQQPENSKRVDAADAAAKTSSQSSDKGQEGWRDKEDQNPVGAGGSAALVELNREDSDSKQGGGGGSSTARNAASTALKKDVSKPIKGKSPLGLQDRETRECSNTGVGGSRGGQTRPVLSGGGGGKEEVQVSSENCEASIETVLSKDTSSLTATAPGRRASRWDTIRDDNSLDLWSDREQDNLGSSLQKLGGVQLSSKDNAGEKKPLTRDDSSPLAHRHMKDGKTKREESCQNLDDGFSDWVSRGATSRGNDANWGHDQDKGGGTWQLQKNVSSGLSNWGVERSDGMDREGDLASDYGSEDGKDRAGTDFRPGKDHSDHFGDRESAHWRFLENSSVHHPNRSVHGSRGGDNHFWREWENGGHKLHARNPVGGLQQPNQNWDSDQKLPSDCMEQLDGSTTWVTLEHAEESLLNSKMQVSSSPQGVTTCLHNEAQAEVCDLCSLHSTPKDVTVQDGSEGSDLHLETATHGRGLGHLQPVGGSNLKQPVEEDYYHIDERVKRLMQNFSLVLGREQDTVAVHVEVSVESVPDTAPEAVEEPPVPLTSVGEVDLHRRNMHCWKYPTAGGDWIAIQSERHEASRASQSEKHVWRKRVLNSGVSLCEGQLSGQPDPRKQARKPEADGFERRKLELPNWACRKGVERTKQKLGGSMNKEETVSVSINITNTVVRNEVLAVPEPYGKRETKVKVSGYHSGHTGSNKDSIKLSSVSPHAGHENEVPSGSCREEAGIVTAVDQNRSSAFQGRSDLHLQEGFWHYLDAAGNEKGPFSVSDLKLMVADGRLLGGVSVFRKSDNVWVPVSSLYPCEHHGGDPVSSGDEPLTSHVHKEDSRYSPSEPLPPAVSPPTSDPSTNAVVGLPADGATTFCPHLPSLSHDEYPHFLGYTNGKLHERVMKSFRGIYGRFLNDALESWLSERHPSKMKQKGWIIDDDQSRPAYVHRRSVARVCIPESDESDGDMASGEDLASCANLGTEVDARGVAVDDVPAIEEEFTKETDLGSRGEAEMDKSPQQSWAGLMSSLLMRIFCLLCGDPKSLAAAMSTCKSWKEYAKRIKESAECVDLSGLGPHCSDTMLKSLMGYGVGKLKYVILNSCTNVSSEALGHLLKACSSIRVVEINGCMQLREVVALHPQVEWVSKPLESKRPSSVGRLSVDNKVKTLKIVGRKRQNSSRGLEDQSGYSLDESGSRDKSTGEEESTDADPMMIDSLDSTEKDMANRVEHSLTRELKRVKVGSVRKVVRTVLPNGCNNYKTQELTNGAEEGLHVKKKGDIDPVNCKMKALHNMTSNFKASKKHFGNKRAWDTVNHNGQIVKRKVSASMKKRRLEDSGSRDWETDEDFYDRDQDKERDARPLLRIKKSHWSESEAESSEEDDDVDEASFEEQEEEETEASGSDVASESEGVDEALEDDANEDTESDEGQHGLQEQGSSRDWWGARMTKAAMVPPVTRKYEVIEEYRIVEDKERVEQKMKVHMPDDYEDKFRAAKEKRGDQYAHLDIPDLKKFRPRKRLDEEVLEQEVYGIDPFTYNMLLNTMPADTPEFTEKHKQLFIEERLLRVLNKKVSEFTGSGRAPMEYPLEKVVAQILKDSHGNQALQSFCSGLLKNMQSRRPSDKYVAYRKGLGVVCNKQEGFHEGDFVVEFFGEVYPPWRWYEKQDGIRSLQKKDKDPAPEFYNIVFERPKGDALGYDVLVIDAMHKANFASRLCHSCRPNCEAKVTAVKGNYMIGVYTLRKIEFGEELTFDYCCITESKDEHDSSVCLCGSQGCKGSYLCYTGPGAYDEVLKEYHGLLDRHNLLLQACTSGRVTQRESEDLKQAGLGTCLLHGLPDWVIKYAAGVVAYLNFERQRLPDELMKAEMLKHTGIELDRQDVEVQADGVYNQRLQNLAITLDKVRYILTKLYGQASMAPAPLRMLKPLELVDSIWKGKKSIVAELLQCMAVHAPEGLQVLTRQIREHDPSQKGDIEGNLRKSLLWLRDTLRQVPATCVGRHDAAADLIHLYAYTKYFFTSHDYEVVESPPLLIHSCDLGPKHVGPPVYKWSKQYNKNYVWGQLISWFSQTSIDPGGSLVHNCRGCLMLPDISSCYAKTPQHDFRRGYSDKDRKKMIAHMENQPQKKWTPKYTPELWNFRSDRCLYGSPMMDAVVSKSKLNKECMEWLKSRDTVFHGPWDDGP
ncbi:unnamed protein product [Sphagnum troendelagicum]